MEPIKEGQPKVDSSRDKKRRNLHEQSGVTTESRERKKYAIDLEILTDQPKDPTPKLPEPAIRERSLTSRPTRTGKRTMTITEMRQVISELTTKVKKTKEDNPTGDNKAPETITRQPTTSEKQNKIHGHATVVASSETESFSIYEDYPDFGIVALNKNISMNRVYPISEAPAPSAIATNNISANMNPVHTATRVYNIQNRMDPLVKDPANYGIGDPLEVNSKIAGIPSNKTTIDTGSGCNAISGSWLNKHPQQNAPRTSWDTPFSLVTVGGQTDTAQDMIQLQITIAGYTYNLWFFILPHLQGDILIGRPDVIAHKILDTIGVTFNDFSNKFSSFYSCVPPLLEPIISNEHDVITKKHEQSHPLTILAAHTRKLEPFTARKIFVAIPEHDNDPEIYMVPNHNKTKALMFPSFLRGDFKTPETSAYIWPSDTLFASALILNNTRKTIKIKKGTTLGDGLGICDADIERTEIRECGNKNILDLLKTNVSFARIKHRKALIQKLNAKKCPKLTEPETTFAEMCKIDVTETSTNPETHYDIDEETITDQRSKHDKMNMSLDTDLDNVVTEFNLKDCDLTGDQTLKLAKLLLKYKEIWDPERKEQPIIHTDAAKMEILTEGPPIRQKLRRTTPAEDHIVYNHITKMLARKVIRPSTSPWAAPIMLADKKGGKIRFCIDYRRLNSVTIKDSYPLPRMDEILTILGGSSYYSMMDLTDAFWSIEIKEEHKHKTTFATKFGLWEFNSMPFGLSNSPATQQRMMEKILTGLTFLCCFVYIDDIVVFSRSFDEHLEHLEQIFIRLKDHFLLLQPQKCQLCKPSFEILGFIASRDGLRANPKKVKAIIDYPFPTTKSEVETFLGMVAWLRKLIPHCSTLTMPFKLLTRKNSKSIIEKTEELQRTFDIIKYILTSEPVMAHPNFDEEFFIHVDASSKGLGAILTQLDDNSNHRIIEYASKSLNAAQAKYSNPVREGLGVLWALGTFKYYVYGRSPTVYCDCSAISHIYGRGTNKCPDNLMLREWAARIMQFDIKLKHKPGKLMAIPDALSRHHHVKYNVEEEDQDVNKLSDLIGLALNEYEKKEDAYGKSSSLDGPTVTDGRLINRNNHIETDPVGYSSLDVRRLNSKPKPDPPSRHSPGDNGSPTSACFTPTQLNTQMLGSVQRDANTADNVPEV